MPCPPGSALGSCADEAIRCTRQSDDHPAVDGTPTPGSDTTRTSGLDLGKARLASVADHDESRSFESEAPPIDLLHDPFKVEKDPAVAWKTALWFWDSQKGAGTVTPHDAIVGNRGFGETIRSINGDLECNGKNPDERNDRINLFKKFVGVLGTNVGGGNISC
ncbi:chitinase [Kitasatospora sp. NPDC053057]|uniref:chitinase n=1 Tax=Kitasatospora sp. NPDC053057 TaxID=3364062 RepID=UPI0037C6FA6B